MSNLSDLVSSDYAQAVTDINAAIATGGGATGRVVYKTITNEDNYVIPAVNPLYATALEAKSVVTAHKRVLDFDGSDLPSSVHSNVSVGGSGNLSPSYDGVSTAAGNIHMHIKYDSAVSYTSWAKYSYGSADVNYEGQTYSGIPCLLGAIHRRNKIALVSDASTTYTINFTRLTAITGSTAFKILLCSDFSTNKFYVTDITNWDASEEKIWEAELVVEAGNTVYLQNPVLVVDVTGSAVSLQTTSDGAVTVDEAMEHITSYTDAYWVNTPNFILATRWSTVQNIAVMRTTGLLINKTTGASKWFYDPFFTRHYPFEHNNKAYYWTFTSADLGTFGTAGSVESIKEVSIDDFTETTVTSSNAFPAVQYRSWLHNYIKVGDDIVAFDKEVLFNFTTGAFVAGNGWNIWRYSRITDKISYVLQVSEDWYYNLPAQNWNPSTWQTQTDQGFYFAGLISSYTNGGYVEKVINTIDAVSIDGPLSYAGSNTNSISYSIAEVGINNKPLTYEPTAGEKAAIINLDSVTFRIDINMTDTTIPPILDYIKIPVTVKDRFVVSTFLETQLNSTSVNVVNSGLTDRNIMISVIEA